MSKDVKEKRICQNLPLLGPIKHQMSAQIFLCQRASIKRVVDFACLKSSELRESCLSKDFVSVKRFLRQRVSNVWGLLRRPAVWARLEIVNDGATLEWSGCVVLSVITVRHDKTSSGNRQLGDRSQAGPDAGGQPATQLCEPLLTQKYQTRPSNKYKIQRNTNSKRYKYKFYQNTNT